MKKFRLLRLDHIVIDTENLRQSLDFYAKLPGVKISVEKGRGLASLGQQKINIHPYPPVLSPVALHPATGHQSFGLEYPGTPERFREYILPPRAAATAAGQGGFFLNDPDGNRVEIGFDRTSPQGLPRIRHLTLATADMEASLRFYAKTLGMEVVQSEKRLLCRLGSGCLCIVAEGRDLIRGAGDFCLITDMDIEAVRRELAGAPLVQDLGIVLRHGALGPMRSVYLRDPDGNLVEIAEYLEKRPGA